METPELNLCQEWYDQHSLFHYTRSVDAVASIFELGFLLVPNRRYLIHKFLPDEDFSGREPQEYGMVSFTELPAEVSDAHREKYGDFGIQMTWEWALRNGAERVLYLGTSGRVFAGFAALFEIGRDEAWNNPLNPHDRTLLQNKIVAGIYGAKIWTALLTLYEYMQPEADSSQVEWRIVNETPLHRNIQAPAKDDDEGRRRLIDDCVRAAKVWHVGTVPVKSTDVVALLCPPGREQELRAVLPEPFKRTTITAYRDASGT